MITPFIPGWTAHFAGVIWAFMDSEGWTLIFLESGRLEDCHSQLPSYRNKWEELSTTFDVQMFWRHTSRWWFQIFFKCSPWKMGTIRILTNIVFSWGETTNQHKLLSFKIWTSPTGCLVVSLSLHLRCHFGPRILRVPLDFFFSEGEQLWRWLVGEGRLLGGR